MVDPPAPTRDQPPGPDGSPAAAAAPTIGLPKGGGAIRGIGEKFAANPVTGSGSMTVPIFASPGRSGFGPQLALTYDSGAGNGPFGLGWSLPVPAITRKTDRGLPRYLDSDESDVFILAGVEDLVPFAVEQPAGRWHREDTPSRVANGRSYRIDRYRPRIDGAHALIERWTDERSLQTQWRTVTATNVTTIFGADADSRIADPADPLRVYSWLISHSFDDKGNVVVYSYKPEDYAGVNRAVLHERNRDHTTRGPQRYLKRIRYGNLSPYTPDLARATPVALPDGEDWMFELVLDYGDHDADAPTPTESAPTAWPARRDAFSTYRPGFELRTHRLCRRALMFHHFAGEPGVGRDCLVHSTNFHYDLAADDNDGLGAPFTHLQRVWQMGHKRKPAPHDDRYRSAAAPPVQFTYTRPTIADTTADIDSESLKNLPTGIAGGGYRWVDLDGEGLSGVLTEHGGAWFYKPNLGPGPDAGPTFGPATVVAQRPSSAALAAGRQQLLDLDGNGALELVDFAGENPGCQERTIDGGWRPCVPFASLPTVDWNDPDLRFVDLTGDGHADLLVTQDEVFIWYPSLAAAGFAAAQQARQPRDEEDGPHLVFADSTQTIFTADMSGDGLHDLVRVRPGEVSYWPSVGYGRFAAKVTMDNAPAFDHPDRYDPRRIRLADVDGSGPTDIVYLGDDGARLYLNRSGNALTDARLLPFPVATDRLEGVQLADLFGNGTACLVLSSELPADARTPARYLDLMGPQKPYLLTAVDNNLGAVTTIEYAPSTRFYLADKLAGRPWITRLPFPVHCVERVTVTDRWRGTTFSSRYSYHHGYFDGVEREFRGFGRVEQVDVEDYGHFAAANADSPFITADQTLYQPPVKTITWTHTGAALDGDRMLAQFQREYFPHALAAAGTRPVVAGFAEKAHGEPQIDATHLTADEWRQALRACKGTTLRQEVYELDVDLANATPVRLFSAVSHEYDVRRLQPAVDDRFAVFELLERESISYHYELDLRSAGPLRPDPRVSHTLNLSFDEFGNVEESVAVGYPRFAAPAPDPALAEHAALIAGVQSERHIAYATTRHTDPASSIDPASGAEPIQHYRLPVACEAQTFELTDVAPQPGQTYFTVADLAGLDAQLTHRDYHELPQPGQPTMRLVEHTRTLFFDDDPADGARFLASPLALGELGRRGLVYESYRLALSAALLGEVLGARFDATVRAALDAPGTGGYWADTALPDRWWIRSGRAGFVAGPARRFFLPERYTDAFGHTTTVQYDGRALFVASSQDALGNLTSIVRFDYRVLAPAEMLDVNANLTEASFDVLGRVIAVALKGKGTEADSLAGFDDDLANPSADELDAVFAAAPDDPTVRRMLGDASTRFLYHFGEASAGGVTQWAARPAGACTIVRERHVAMLAAGEESPLQVAFESSDGQGTVLMRRSQAEPEQAGGPLRWIVSAKTVHNNKGMAVKQYEPYFSASAIEDTPPDAVGVTPLMYYDAVGRLMRTEAPDGSFSRVAFSPWQTASYDANDTVIDSRWFADRGAPDPGHALAAGASPDTRAAWLAAQHAGTPSLTILDSLGRSVIAVAHNRTAGVDERYVTYTKLDAEGKPLWIRDPRGNVVMRYQAPPNSVPGYDVAGNLLFQHSMDAGDRWTLGDATGKALFAWNVGQRQQPDDTLVDEHRRSLTQYDALRRPIAYWLVVDDGAAKVVQRWEYVDGGAPAPFTAAAARNRNLCNELHRHFDASGLVEVQALDFKGGPLEVHRQLTADPRAPATDWQTDPQASLDTETFVMLTEYDALKRATRVLHWHRLTTADKRVAVTEPAYNARGLLASEQLVVHARRTAAASGRRYAEVPGVTQRSDAIAAIAYDAKGLRLSVKLGSGTTTRYEYDPQTLRLRQLRTTRPQAGRADPPFPAFAAHLADARVLQQLLYTYDAVGNVTEIADEAYKPVFWGSGVAEPRSLYAYDALSRLISASGRETAQGGAGAVDGSEPPIAGGFPVTGQTLRRYTETYRYDAVGNFTSFRHAVAGQSSAGWTRHYETQPDSNRMRATWTGSTRVGQTEHRYDTHGNALNVARVSPDRFLRWDHRDMVASIDLGGGGTAFYQYDSTKHRTRKHIDDRTGGGHWERIDLGGTELYRRYRAGSATPAEEIETLHMLEGGQRVLVVDQIITTTRAGLSPSNLHRYTLSNHLGSSTAELDEHGAIISCEEYHPYGATAYRSGRSTAEVKLKRYRYTGVERDEESGLSYHGARYYAIALATWLSCDHPSFTDGLCLYQYVRGNPIRFRDASGGDAGPGPGYLARLTLTEGAAATEGVVAAEASAAGGAATTGGAATAGEVVVGGALGTFAVGAGLMVAAVLAVPALIALAAVDLESRQQRYGDEARADQQRLEASRADAGPYQAAPTPASQKLHDQLLGLTAKKVTPAEVRQREAQRQRQATADNMVDEGLITRREGDDYVRTGALTVQEVRNRCASGVQFALTASRAAYRAFDAIPTGDTVVYTIRDAGGAVIYVGITTKTAGPDTARGRDAITRLLEHLGTKPGEFLGEASEFRIEGSYTLDREAHALEQSLIDENPGAHYNKDREAWDTYQSGHPKAALPPGNEPGVPPQEVPCPNLRISIGIGVR